MKYSVALFAFVAGVIAQDSSSITSAPVPSASLDPSIASLVSCVNSCSPEDVTCQAACAGVARPNSSQAVDTNNCAAKCDQGDGSEEETAAYAKCQQDCFASLFPSTQTIAPFAPGAAQSGAPSQSGSNNSGGNAASTGASGSGSNGTPTASGSRSPSASESGAQANESGAAGINSAPILGAGLAGFMAIFAL